MRASTFRRPVSSAATRFACARSASRSSAVRVPACSAASSSNSQGWIADAPAASSIATSWTSKQSPHATTRSVEPRRPALSSSAWTRPTARIVGIADAPRAEGIVGQHDQRRATTGGRGRLASQPPEGVGQPARPAVGGPGRVEGDGPPGESLEEARPGIRVEDRAVEDGDVRPSVVEQARLATDRQPQGHHRALALRVDRRVGDLGEGLAQVRGHAPRAGGERSDRGVVAHAPGGLPGLGSHRLHQLANDLGVEAQRDALPRAARCAGGNRGRSHGTDCPQARGRAAARMDRPPARRQARRPPAHRGQADAGA